MKKSTVVILIVALCLFIAGVIVCGSVFLMSGFDFLNKEPVSYTEKEETITEDFVNIEVEALSGNIELFPTSSDECVVEYADSEDVTFKVDVEGDTLKVIRDDTRKWYEFIGVDFNKEYVKVYLPQGVYEDITLNTASGKIVVNDGLSCYDLKAESLSGSIRAYAVTAEGTITLNSTSGAVVADTIVAKDMKTEATSGKTTLGNIGVSDKLEVKGTSGKIEISQVNCNSVSVENASGAIILSDVIAESSFDVECVSGKIQLLGCDADNLEIDNVSGSVSGTLLSDKVFDASSTSGRVKVPDTTQGGVCKVRTTSGSIDIDIK